MSIQKVADIPCNYNGVMAVSIMFMDKYSLDRFELLGKFDGGSDSNVWDLAKPILNGNPKYKRIAIRRKIQVMNIELHEMIIRDIAENNVDINEGGAVDTKEN